MREWFAVVVKVLLTGSVCCLVYGQRKESCNVGVSTIASGLIIRVNKGKMLEQLT